MTTHPSRLLRTIDPMEDPSKSTDSVTDPVSIPSDIVHPHHRQSVPDVPEDIDEIMPHFNDPNWDFRDNNSTLSISTDGAESQRWSKIAGPMGSGTEVNTESRISSWHIHDTKADLSSKEQVQLRVLLLSCVPFCLPMSFSSGIHRTLRSARPLRTLMTRQCL